MVVKTISQGQLAKVQHAVLKSDPSQHFAIKVFNKMVLRKQKEYFKAKSGRGMEVRDQLMKVREFEIKGLVLASKVRHPNVVQLHEIIDDELEYDLILLIMDYCELGQVLTWE